MLAANQPVAPGAFRFPEFSRVTLPAAQKLSSMEEVVQLMRSSPFTDMLLRAGLKDPEWRAKAESTLGRAIDWSQVASGDATVGRDLKLDIERHLGGLPPPTGTTGGGPSR
jgi:hypothetical protein